MRETALKQLVAGMTARMKAGSPVRQWMRIIRDGGRRLTPVHYIPRPENVLTSGSGQQFVEVKIARLMSPYAIVYHHNGRGWVKLWIDTREVPLYSPCR